MAIIAVLVAAACGSSNDAPVDTVAPLSPSTPSPPDQPLDRALANGLEVRVVPSGTGDRVAVMVVYAIGELHDPPGASGLAHFAEHLYVTGATVSASARTVDDIVAGYPLGWNAQTTPTATIIATVVEPPDVDAELIDAAGRMRGIEVSADLVARERERILAESRNMYGGIPALAAQNLAKDAVEPRPQDGRRGGQPAELDAMSSDQLQQRLDQVYGPTNATLVVAGDIDPARINGLIDEHFGPIPAGRPVEPPATPGVGDPSTVEVSVSPAEDGAVGDMVAYGFAVPPASDPDHPAALMGITRLLQLTQVPGVELGYALLEDPSVLTVAIAVESGETAEQAADRLATSIEALVAPPLGSDEAEAVRAQLGPLLGLTPHPPDAIGVNPYQPALTAALAPTVVPDPDRLTAALRAMTDEQYRAAVELFDPAAATQVRLTVER